MNGTDVPPINQSQPQQQHMDTERELVDFVEIVYLSLSVCIGTLLNSVAVVRLIRYSKSPSAYAKHHCLIRPLHMNSFTMFKFNLAFTDFAILFIHALGKMVWLLSYRWLFGDLGCRLYQFLSAFAYYSNSNVVVAIGLDRLKVVYSGQVQGVSSSTRRVRNFLIVAWLLAAICALPQLFFWTDFELGLGWSQCTTIWQIAEYSQAFNLISSINLTSHAPDNNEHHQQQFPQQQNDSSWSANASTQLLYELLHQVIVFIIPLISLSGSYLLIVVRVLRYSLRPPPNSNLLLCSSSSINCADQWASTSAAADAGDDGQNGKGTTVGGRHNGGWHQRAKRIGQSARSRNFLLRFPLLGQQQRGGDELLLQPSSSTSFSTSRSVQHKFSPINTPNINDDNDDHHHSINCLDQPFLTQSATATATNINMVNNNNYTKNDNNSSDNNNNNNVSCNGSNCCRRQCTAPPPSPSPNVVLQKDDKMKANGDKMMPTKFPYFVVKNGINDIITSIENNRQPTIDKWDTDWLHMLSQERPSTTTTTTAHAQSDNSQKWTKCNGEKHDDIELYNFPCHFHHYRTTRRRCSGLLASLANVGPSSTGVEEHQQLDIPITTATTTIATTSFFTPSIPTNFTCCPPPLVSCRAAARPQMLPHPAAALSADGGQTAGTARHRIYFGAGAHRRVSAASTIATAGPISPLWRRQMRSKVFIRSLLIVAAHCAFWLPYNLLNVLRFTDESLYTRLVDRGALLVEDLIIMNSLINPVLYDYGK